MTFLFAFLFAQSLLGDLSPAAPAPKPSAPVVAPYAAANVEANAAVMAKTEVAEVAEEKQVVEEKQEVADEGGDAPAARRTEPADEGGDAPAAHRTEPAVRRTEFDMPRSVKITSERTDYDRREGVIMFDKNVFVDDAEYKMHSDQLYVFLDGTNELKRIVAIGNVSITNETRVGSCAKAAYTKSVGKVVMYGDSSGVRAKLADYGKRKSEVEGRKITFWIDSEQVEVEGSTVTLDAGGYGGKEGAKKLLGK